jgi:hypothetical protein
MMNRKPPPPLDADVVATAAGQAKLEAGVAVDRADEAKAIAIGAGRLAGVATDELARQANADRAERERAARMRDLDPSMEAYARRRWSPRRGWRDVAEFDERVAELEQRQARVLAEMTGLHEQIPVAERADTEAMATWVTEQRGSRPLPTVPALEQRVAELQQECDALTLAVQRVLDKKERYVEKHRGRLLKEARKAHEQTVAEFRRLVDEVERTRGHAADCVEALRWALEFPGEGAASNLRLELAKGGRVPKVLPEFKTIVPIAKVFEWLREDAAWLARALDPKHERDLDVREQAVWTGTDEGEAAVRREKARILEQMRPRNVHRADWLDR